MTTSRTKVESGAVPSTPPVASQPGEPKTGPAEQVEERAQKSSTGRQKKYDGGRIPRKSDNEPDESDDGDDDA